MLYNVYISTYKEDVYIRMYKEDVYMYRRNLHNYKEIVYMYVHVKMMSISIKRIYTRTEDVYMWRGCLHIIHTGLCKVR